MSTKLVSGLKNLRYEDRLQRLKLSLTTLEKRRLRGDLIEAFKIMTAREKIDKHEYFDSSNNAYSLRGHKYKIAVQRSRTVARTAFFSQRVVTSWNKLPDDVVNATSINMFKNWLDECN